MALHGDRDTRVILSKYGGKALGYKRLADTLRKKHRCRLIGILSTASHRSENSPEHHKASQAETSRAGFDRATGRKREHVDIERPGNAAMLGRYGARISANTADYDSGELADSERNLRISKYKKRKLERQKKNV